MLTTTGTFTLLSLCAANANTQVADPANPISVQFTGLLRGAAVPGCGATDITQANACSNGLDPCPATQVSFTGCEGIDALQMTASTTNPNTFYCVALDSIVVQACSLDSSISAAAPYVGIDPVGP